MINMSLDIANNLAHFVATLLGIFIVLGGFVASYAHLKGRIATLEDRAERSEREHKEFKIAIEQETKRIEVKLEALQLGIGQVLEALSALKAEMRVRFETRANGRGKAT